MTISRVHADTDADVVYSASATSVSVTIDAAVQEGDLILIFYMTRHAVTVPTGFTKYAEVLVGVGPGADQRHGWFAKTSDGTEGGTTVSVVQASANRIEAGHLIYRSSVGDLTPSQATTYPSDGTSSVTLSDSETQAFMAVSLLGNVYSSSISDGADLIAGTDAEWTQLVFGNAANTDQNRNMVAEAIYSGADTTTVVWGSFFGDNEWWAANLLTITEPAAPPTQTTTLITQFDAGNVDPALSTITNPDSNTPLVEVDRRSATGTDWKHMLFALEGVDGKDVTVRFNRATMQSETVDPLTTCIPLYTTDFLTWTQAPSRTLSGGSTGYIEATFTGLPAGRVYISTHPLQQGSYAATFAAELLSSYSSVAAPTSSGDASGVYNTTPAETDEDANPIGGNDQYAIKLTWGGSTTDGKPKRKLVMTAGIHAAGEAFSWIAWEAAIRWMLDDASAEAANLRANWDVYLYFNITANGLKGGHYRSNFRDTKDPNRDWTDQTLQELAAVTAAITLDTGGAADSFIAWHTWGEKTTLYFVAGNAQTTVGQAFVGNLNTISGETAEEGDSSLIDADFGWAAANLGAPLAIAGELGMRAPNSVSAAQAVGENYMKALEATDQQGYFTSTTLTAEGAVDDFAVSSDAAVAVTGDAAVSVGDAALSSVAAVDVDATASLQLSDASVSSTIAAQDEAVAESGITLADAPLSSEGAVSVDAASSIAAGDVEISALALALAEAESTVSLDGASVSSEAVTEGREIVAELTLDGFTISSEIGDPVPVGGGGSSGSGRPPGWNPKPYERKGLDKLKEATRERRLIEAARAEDEHLLEAVKKLLMEAA